MALITDPDYLNDETEIVIGTAAKTIQLVVGGNLSTDGVTIKCVYSKLKELWKNNATYIKFAFPMGPITDEQFEMVNGWDWKDNTTRYLLRTGGWAVKDSGGVSLEEWAGIMTLGDIGASDQAYFLQSGAGAATNFQLTGPVNQAIKVYGDALHGDFDYRSYLKVYCRIYAKSYAFSQLSAIGVSSLTYQAYRFPLSNAADIKITHTDANVIGAEPYFGAADLTLTDGSVTAGAATLTSTTGGFTAGDVGKFVCIASGTNMGFYKIISRQSSNGITVDRNFGFSGSSISLTVNPVGMSITWYNSAQQRSIGGVNRNFHVIVDANSGTAEQVYEFVQYQLRQNNDIDAGTGTQTGKISDALLRFVGDTLYTSAVTAGGTYIDNYLNADVNRLVFTDDAGQERVFPYTAMFTLNFGDNLVNDAQARYWVYFTNDDAGSNAGADYGTTSAIIVNTNESFATTKRAVAANTATITTASAHGLSIGDGVNISGITDSSYNGNFIITGVTSTSFTYALTHAGETETADTGGTVKPNMTGKVNGSSNKQLTFAYDSNIQRGSGSNAVDVPVTCVGIGLTTGQFVKATTTIQRSTSNSASLVAPLERNYQNPA